MITKKAAELVAGLFLTDKSDPSVIPGYPKKTRISAMEKPSLPHVMPEAAGMSSVSLERMLTLLETEPRANVHSLLVCARGQVVLSTAAPGYSTRLWHLAHSMSKTVTGMAIGLLVDEGRLRVQTRVVDLFPEYMPKDKRFGCLTVEHLLCMQSGVDFSEEGVITEEDWLQAFFSSSMSFAPGTAFHYNSMNSYVLSAIVHRISGMELSEYLYPRLFLPLGIENYDWEKCPAGEGAGGFGLYLSPESWCKLGLLMLGDGVYQGRRILSSEWVRAATGAHAITPEKMGDFDYGYQMWVSRRGKDFLFNGMLGQNVWVSPEHQVVAVLFCGNNELFSESPALSILRRTLQGRAAYLPGNRRDQRLLARHAEAFFENRRYVVPPVHRGFSLWRRNRDPFVLVRQLEGSYVFRQNNIGILPAFLRVMQNNHSGGIRRIHLTLKEDHLLFTSSEGKGDYTFRVGLYEHMDNHFLVNGERYMVRAIGEPGVDAEGRPLLKMELCFPEMPNVRRLKLSLTEEGTLLFRMSEIPNDQMVGAYLDSLESSGSMLSLAVDALERFVEKGFIRRKLNEFFFPTLIGISETSPELLRLLAREEDARVRERNSMGFLLGLLMRLVGVDPREEAGEVPARGFFSRFKKS